MPLSLTLISNFEIEERASEYATRAAKHRSEIADEKAETSRCSLTLSP